MRKRPRLSSMPEPKRLAPFWQNEASNERLNPIASRTGRPPTRDPGGGSR